jgi:dUTPase
MARTKKTDALDIDPRLTIPYTLTTGTNPVSIIPTKIDDGLYRLKAAERYPFASGRQLLVRTGVRLEIPPVVDVAPYKPEKLVGGSAVYSRMSLHGVVTNIFNTARTRELYVLGPQIIPSMYREEIVLLVMNFGKTSVTLNPGEEIAELHFSMAPISVLGLNQIMTERP